MAVKKAYLLTCCQYIILVLMTASCASYRQNIMFKVPEGYALQQAVAKAEQEYTLRQDDYLTLDVYTHRGERLIDPDGKLQETTSAAGGATAPTPPKYLINAQGLCHFPMVGDIKLEGLTLLQAEGVLHYAYAKFYESPYVRLTVQNKRVVVLGAPGGQVIPLNNEHMRLTEVLALAHGVSNDAKAHNIRVLRGKDVMVADLSTLDGYTKHNYVIESGDIVYVEPIRRPLVEGLRDYLPLLSIVTSISTLAIVLTTL